MRPGTVRTGRRVRKSLLSASTSYVYDGANSVQEQSSGAVTANMLSGGVDEYFQRADATGTYFYLTDALGSTVAMSDSSGAVQTTYSYGPYGMLSATGSNTNPYTYTGRESDGLGLDYYRARYYNPTTGRFISEDPIGFAGGVNQYAYVENDPIDFYDPFGSDKKAANNNNCFTPNWLQDKGIALQQKLAQNLGHPLGFGAGVSGGVGIAKSLGLAGTASAQMVVNPNGNAFLVYTYGGSFLTTPWLTIQTRGAGVVGGLQFSTMTSTNPTASDLSGPALDASAGGGDGLGVAGDLSYSNGLQGTMTVGGAAGGYGGAGVLTNSVAIPSCSNQP